MLQISTKSNEEFTVEVAYSNEDNFPINEFPILPLNLAEVGIEGLASDASRRLRLPQLWRQQEQVWDYWWEITPNPSAAELTKRLSDLATFGRTEIMPVEEALQCVGPAVSDAIDKIVEFGMPLFRKIARCKGFHINF